MLNTNIKKDFYYLYNEITALNFVKNDMIAMGNFAIFMDYYVHNSNWSAIRGKLRECILLEDRNTFNFIIVNGIYNIAKQMNFGNSIDYLKGMRAESYEKKTLYRFDIIFDEYDFPSWFKSIMEYKSLSTKPQAVSRILYEADKIKRDILLKSENLEFLNYLVDFYFVLDNWIETLDGIMDMVKISSENEMCWHLTTLIYDSFMKILYKSKREAQDKMKLNEEISICKTSFNVFHSLYQKNQLKFINVIPEEIFHKNVIL